MSGFFTRLFKLFQAEADTALSRLEDPVKLSEQGVRDLKSTLSEAVISLAQVKSVAIRIRKQAEDEKRQAEVYEQKAVALLRRAQEGELASAEADRLASEVLNLKSAAEEHYDTLNASALQQEQLAAQLQSRIEGLKRDVSRYEGELAALRARSSTARSVKKINQHLAGADGSSTVAMLERMREKVVYEEALAEAYEQLGDSADGMKGAEKALELEVDKALLGTSASSPRVADSLAELKARLSLEDSA